MRPLGFQCRSLLIASFDGLIGDRFGAVKLPLKFKATSLNQESPAIYPGECQFLETNTEYFPTGSTTFRKADQQVGGEPDESYCIGTDKEFPDLAIEVVVTHGGINRLALYQRLGVQEVWFWQENRLAIYHLRQDCDQFTSTFGYEAINCSEVLPELNIELLTECIQNPSPLAAAKAFRQGLQ